jgi:hypothetical protein
MFVSQELKINNKNDKVLSDKRRSSLLLANLSRQTFLMLMGVEVAVLALAGYFFFVRGANKELVVVRADLTSKQEQLSQASNKLNNFSVINKIYEGLDGEVIKKVGQVLPVEPNLPDLMVNLDTLVKNNGFSLVEIDFQIVDSAGQEVFSAQNAEPEQVTNEAVAAATTATTKELKTINISLNIEGSSYSGLKSLISQLENNLRLFDVLKFGFTSEGTSLKIELRAYYL